MTFSWAVEDSLDMALRLAAEAERFGVADRVRDLGQLSHERARTLTAGALAAVGGLIVTSRLNSATPIAGEGYELDSIAAVVIGGTSLSGGRGSIQGTVLGALIIGVLNSGLVILGVDPFWQKVIKGFVILVAVVAVWAGILDETIVGNGFEWIDCHDSTQSVLSYLRRDGADYRLVVLNFTPVVRRFYRIGVPDRGLYREVFNSDSRFYGGSNVHNGTGVRSEDKPWMGRPHSISLTIPPLGALVLTLSGEDD